MIGPRSSEFRTNISNLNKPRGFEDDVCHFFRRRFWREKMLCLGRYDSERKQPMIRFLTEDCYTLVKEWKVSTGCNVSFNMKRVRNNSTP